MNDRKFSLTVMAIFAILTLAVVTFNYWMDPLWNFSHAHEYNDVQLVTDEREQKTANQIYVPKTEDTLLLGSSRSTYIHHDGFKDWKVYNYSVANLSMREYYTMMDFAFEQNPDYERVILGVDFFKSSTQEAEAPRSIQNHVKRVTQPFYRAKNLLSFDLMKTSAQNLQMSADDEITEDRLYNREGDAFARKLSEEETLSDTEDKIKKFESTFYGKSYTYYPRYKEIMKKVHDLHPEAEKMVYTTPISSELFKSLVSTGLYEEYEIWLRDLVEVYGGVWNFMYPNSVTNDITNYYDGHHFYPEVGYYIASRMEQGDNAEAPEDFGVYVTPDTIDSHLKQVKKLVDELK